MVLFKRLKSKLAIGVAAAAALCAVTVGPASPAMASGTSCASGYGSALTVCMYVDGASLYINYLQSWTKNNSSIKYCNLHMQLVGPPGTINNSAQGCLNPGQTSNSLYYYYYNNEPAGRYCVALWQAVGSGYTKIAEPCVTVYSS
jgi:hypothetical protein